MDVAFLFNANHFERSANYATAIDSIVFGLGILQRSGRHMKVGHGDVVTFGKASSRSALRTLNDAVYSPRMWSAPLHHRLLATYGSATVYSLVFHNTTVSISSELHHALVKEESYLGALEVDFSYGPHLVFFRNYIGTQYRIQGAKCRILYAMGDRENSCFESMLDEMRANKFEDVECEDRGAHGTVFDDFDTLQHFQRIAMFRLGVSKFLGGGDDEASDLVFVLEDLNPRLFWTLAAAFSALDGAATEEEVAQASLSGRRFLEQLADVLFPPSEEPHEGRRVGKGEYRNRIWAFVGNHADHATRERLGNEIDRIVREFNVGLHANGSKAGLEKAFADLALLTAALLALDPDAFRKPYYAHQARLAEFFRAVVRDKNL